MIIEKSTAAEQQETRKRITEYNAEKVPFLMIPQDLHYTVRDENGSIKGSILASLGYWKGLQISVLWVDEKYRGQGIGTTLLRKAENEARELGGLISMVDTFDFHSEDFYLKNGYKPFGQIQGFPGESNTWFYLSKKL